jgi:hypothetical protein
VPRRWSGRLRAAALTSGWLGRVSIHRLAAGAGADPVAPQHHVARHRKVERPLALSDADLQALPRKRLAVTDQKWTPVTYDGVPVVELLRRQQTES